MIHNGKNLENNLQMKFFSFSFWNISSNFKSEFILKNQKIHIPDQVVAGKPTCQLYHVLVANNPSPSSSTVSLRIFPEEKQENARGEEWAYLVGPAVRCQFSLGDRGRPCGPIHCGRLSSTLCCCGLVLGKHCIGVAHLLLMHCFLVFNESNQECKWWAECWNGLESLNTTLRVVYSYHVVILLKKGVNCVNYAVSIIPCKERLKGQLWRSHALLITLLWNKETDEETEKMRISRREESCKASLGKNITSWRSYVWIL